MERKPHMTKEPGAGEELDLYQTPGQRPVEEVVRGAPDLMHQQRAQMQRALMICGAVVGFVLVGAMLVLVLAQRRAKQEVALPPQPEERTLELKADEDPSREFVRVSTNQALQLTHVNVDLLLREVAGYELRELEDEGGGAAVVAEERETSMVRLLTELAAKDLEEGNLEEAVRQLQRARDINPQAEAPQHLLAVAWLRQGQLAEAAAVFEGLLEINPAEVVYLNNLAVCRIQLGRLADAEPLLEQALRLDEDFLDARVNQAAIDFRRERYERVINGLYPVRGRLAEHYLGRRYLAGALLEVGDTLEARALFERMATEELDDPRPVLGMAKSFMIDGKPAVALGWLRSLAERCDGRTFEALTRDPVFDEVRAMEAFRDIDADRIRRLRE